MSPERRAAGVITASAGNHGLGVAYAAAQFHVRGNRLCAAGGQPAARSRRSSASARRWSPRARPTTTLSWPRLPSRSGPAPPSCTPTTTPTWSPARAPSPSRCWPQLQGFDTVVVPIGGGGLIGGISMYLKARHPSVRVIGVEPTGADAMRRSLRGGPHRHARTRQHHRRRPGGVVARHAELRPGAALRRPGDHGRGRRRCSARSALLFEWEHLLAEPAGAAGLAALLFHPSEIAAGRRVVVGRVRRERERGGPGPGPQIAPSRVNLKPFRFELDWGVESA